MDISIIVFFNKRLIVINVPPKEFRITIPVSRVSALSILLPSLNPMYHGLNANPTSGQVYSSSHSAFENGIKRSKLNSSTLHPINYTTFINQKKIP